MELSHIWKENSSLLPTPAPSQEYASQIAWVKILALPLYKLLDLGQIA